jgi:hypothetical protein
MFKDLLADVMPPLLFALVFSAGAVSAAAGLAMLIPR